MNKDEMMEEETPEQEAEETPAEEAQGTAPAGPQKSMNPADAEAAKKVVLGCLKIMFDKQTHQYLVQGMQGPAPMPLKLATNVVGVMKMFAGRAQGQIPRQVLIPAASMLVMELARFAAQAGLGKPTGADIKAAMPIVVKLVKEAFPAQQPQQPAAKAPEQSAQQPMQQQPMQPRGLIGNAMMGG